MSQVPKDGPKVAWGGTKDLSNVFEGLSPAGNSTGLHSAFDTPSPQGSGGLSDAFTAEPDTTATPPTATLTDAFGTPASAPRESGGPLSNVFAEPAEKSSGEPDEGTQSSGGLADAFNTPAATTPPTDGGAKAGNGEKKSKPKNSATPPAGSNPLANVFPSVAETPAPAAAPPQVNTNPNPFGTASQTPTNAEPGATSVSDQMAQMRAAVQASAAQRAQAEVQVSLETQALATEERYTRAEELSEYVAQILGMGDTKEVQQLINQMVLTRDAELDRQQRAHYGYAIQPALARNGWNQSDSDLQLTLDIAYDELLGIGPLGPLWRDDSVTEIMVSGPNKVTVERNGRLEITPVKFQSLNHLERTGRALAQQSSDDRAVSRTDPLVTMQLPGARIQFVWHPLAASKVAITIRKFADLLGMDKLLSFQSITPEMAQFLRKCVEARATILVSGGTGSGKTTFINALSEFIPNSERVVTIEDALELQLRNTHVESFVTKEAASADDTLLFGQDQLLKATLRMRPDRIIVGEIRDGAGCAVMLEATNTGHSGTMTTIHADTPDLALRRMSTLIRRVDSMPEDVAREEVASAIDVVVQVVRTRGKRYVSDISVVDAGAAGTTTPIFRGHFPPEANGPEFSQVGEVGADTGLAKKMLDAGFTPTVKEK